MTKDCPISSMPTALALKLCSSSKFACDLLYKWSTHASQAAALCNRSKQALKIGSGCMGEPEQSVRCMLAAAHAARLHAQAAAPSRKEKVGGNDTFRRQCT